MINFFSNLITLITTVLILASCTNNQITCTLKGNISGRNSDTMFLLKATEDLRFAQTKIPIRDSNFKFTLIIPQTEAYELVFKDEAEKGVWRPIYFFPENGEINFKLFAKNDNDKNQIKGSKLTQKFTDYGKLLEKKFMPRYQPISDSISTLMNKKEYYSSEMDSLIKLMRQTRDQKVLLKLRTKIDELKTDGKDLTLKGNYFNKQSLLLRQEVNKWRYEYINANPDILSYYFLIEDLKSTKTNMINTEDIKRSYTQLAKKFPKHPYTALVNNLLKGLETIKIGGKFIDFNAPDLNGNILELSDLIKNKIALIDLWASWCGPCIITSRSMIPVYEEFKEKGFTICGVAAEIKNTEQMIKTISREKFPWTNLVDIDHKHHIWDKYGISNSGGETILVDKDGTILAISPTAEEVKKILNEKLQ